ncbi:hypothetical protein LOAG_03255 [Loa loa]|uniref:Shootin-1 n=1 Tax=Loa loa TaxID=7209 RepID=A0A1I7VT83_LOALO|nr:hypothetical protein LOAG_03255 [Loa loa]EFO25233.2 hypothetical protein LOAG_03255 [Loa loa]
MTSSTSTHSTFSGLSEGCLSEACSSGLQNRTSTEESQEDCPKCAAMRLNTIVAEEALASLSGQFKNLQKELKKTEQVSKINEEQAKYIDERRSKLEKLEAEHTSLYAEYENLRINHDSLKRQYDEVVATARRNQRLIEESVKYHDTCKVAMENLMAEKEARQELLTKYLKSVEAAAKINDSMKQLEKKCVQLQAVNEKLEPFRYHCPAMLRLLLEFGEIIENNGLMTKALQKRLTRYKDRSDLREYLLGKTRRITNLSESSTRTIEESSDDDELAKGVEDLLLTIGSPPRLRSSKKSLSSKEEIRNIEESSANSVKEMLNVRAAEKGNLLKKKLESVKALHVSIPEVQSNSDVFMEKSKTLCKRQLDLTEMQKKEILLTDVEEGKVMFDDVMNVCIPSISSPSLPKKNNEWIENDVHQDENGLQKNILRDVHENFLKSTREKDGTNTSEVETENESSEEKRVYGSTERLSTWLSFVHLDPLLPELGRPTFLDTSEASRQHGSDDYIDNLFGPLSPSISSRQTSVSSTEGCVISKNKTRLRSKMDDTADALTPKEIECLAEPLSLPLVPSSPTHSSMTASTVSASGTSEDSGSLGCIPASTMKAVTVIHNERADKGSVQNLKVSDGINELLSVEEYIPAVSQTSRHIITTGSKCTGMLWSQRKRSESNPQNEERLGIRAGSSKLSKVITTSTDTREDELDTNQGYSTQQLRNEKVISRRAVLSGKKCLEKEGNLVRLPESKVESVLEMLREESDELKAIRNEEKLEGCIDNPVPQGQPLRRSAWKKQARIDSWSSQDNQELMIDTKEFITVQNDLETEVLTQQENVNINSSEAVENQILNVDNIAIHGHSGKEVWNFTMSWESFDERKSSEGNRENSTKDGILSTMKSGNQIAKRKQNNTTQSTVMHVEREITLRNGLESAEIAVECSSKNIGIRESKKSLVTRNNKLVTSEAKKRKLAEELISNVEDKWEDAGQITTSSQKSKMIGTYRGKEPVSENSESTSKSMTSNIKLLEAELNDLNDDDNRLEIVTDDAGVSCHNMEIASGEIHVSNNCIGSEKAKATTVTTKKSISTVRSEMYKKMHKRLAVQTSCMKELGRIQKKTIVSTLSASKKVEQPNITQRKRAAIMLPTGRDVLNKAKSVGLPAIQHSAIRVSTSATKIPVGSDEAAVMCLFDQALSESNYNDKLLEIVQKFQTPTISAISCEKLAECSVKFINKLDVGNMWHSVVVAVRYWSGKQKDRCASAKVLELHQVASSKERNFIEVLHQLSGEEHWSDVISFFLRKMITSLMKTRPVSVAQHGLNIRCILLCTRILLQDGSNNEVLRKVTNLLQHLIERDSSDRVVPMMCYSVAIVPEIVDKLLIDENEQYESVRRVMSVHLASRDELFTIFNKVIMSRLLNKSTYNATCLQKLSIDGFHRWFSESISTIVTDISGLNLESMELSPGFSSAVMTCYALFSLATNRLVPDKEALVLPVLNDCVRIISGHFESEEKERNAVFADTTGLQSLSDDMLVKTMLRLLLFGRLITSFIRSTECCILPQIANLVEKIHRLREFARLKLEQEGETAENRLLYFGLNDWLRTVKPWTKYLCAAFTVTKSD